jgi:hypothetical protein
MSSAPSSQTSKRADQTVPVERAEISFATSDEEAIEIHRFLCVIAQPVLYAPIDPHDSMRGVLDVVHNGAAIVARLSGHIIGSLGLIMPRWWYNTKAGFITDRWFFCYPAFHHLGVGASLLAEADALGKRAGREVIINGHMKRRSSGVSFTRPTVLGAAKPELH